MNKLKHISLIGPIRPILKWLTATRRRKILSSILAILIVLTSIRFAFFNEPKQVKAAKMEILETDSAIQIDVANRYRAILQKGDTDDLLLFYDRGENDSNPDPTHLVVGPSFYYSVSNNYLLRDDDTRTTTVLENTSNRIIIRVAGRLAEEEGTEYAQNDAATQDIGVTYDITFTPQGAYFETTLDLTETGTTLPISGDQYYFAEISADYTDAAFDDTGNILYGDGETESTTSSDGSFSDESTKYVVLPGNGSDTYQDVIMGIPEGGWHRRNDSAQNAFNFYQNNPGTQDTVEVGVDGTSSDPSYFTETSSWFLMFFEENDLDSEDKREAVTNDIRNPDTLSYTTGSAWYDNPASSSLYFDGDYVTVSDIDDIDNVQKASLTAWVRREATNDTVEIGKQSAGGDDFAIEMWSDGLLYFAVSNGSFKNCTISSNDTLWHHVALVFDGSLSETNRIKGYLDGGMACSGATGAPSTTANTTNVFNIGLIQSTDSTGFIDEVRLYNDALTQQQIKDRMLTEIDPATANLVGYWKLNEGRGQTVFDETSNNYDGTLGQYSAVDADDPEWVRTGFGTPDSYNETENLKAITLSSNQAEFDLDAGSGYSTLTNGSIATASATIDVDNNDSWPTTGFGYIEGDKFTYTGKVSGSPDQFTGVPTSGANAILAHDDNTVVSLPSRHNPSFKLRGYRNNNVPTEAVLEGERLQKDYDFLADIKPVTTAYYAQDLIWYSTLESTAANIGTNLTNNGCSFVAAKYGNGIQCNGDNERATVASAGNFDPSKGAIEFWAQPEYDYNDNNWHYFIDINDGSTDFLWMSKSGTNELHFVLDDGPTRWTEVISSTDYSWNTGDWIHFRLEWDENAANTADKQKIFINGVQPPSTDGGDYSASGFSVTTINLSTNSIQECNCIIDEFKIYDFNGSGDRVELQQLASGGIGSNDYFGRDSVNYTFDFNDDDANNRGEYIWIGSDSRFTGVNLDLATDGVGSSLNFDWEYWTATQWAELTVTEQDNGASDWTGSGNFYFTDPGNWFPYSVNGSTDLYYIRGHLEGGSYTTDPVENKVLTDILLFQYTRYGGDITSENMTFEIPGWTSNAPPVAYWKFDAGYGTVAFDAMKDNDLTIKDATWQEESMCVSGSCLRYDGSEDQASRSAQLAELDFSENGSFTLTGWFRHVTGAGGIDTLLSKYESIESDGGYKIYIDSPDNLCFGIDDDNTSFPEDSACSPSSLSDSKWHHFAAVKTGTTQIDLYVDGNRVGYDDNISASATLENNDGFYVGADEGGYQNYWDGSIDEIKVYRYARSADEIKSDYAGGSAVFGDKTDWLSDGLLGYWKLDETALNTCGTFTDGCDDSGNSIDLLAINQATTVDTPGKFGNAVTLDGSGDRYCSNFDDDGSCEDYNQLDFGDTDDFSISLWFYRDTFNSEDTLVAKTSDTTSVPGYGVLVTSFDDVINFRVTDEDIDSCQVWNNTSFTASSWNHLTVTFDQDNIQNFKIFINGVDDTAGTNCTQSQLENIGSLANGNVLSIGALSNGSDAHYGDIDEVRLYNRVLSPAEAQDLYEWAPGPIVYWRLDENSGTSTVYDSSGNGRNGSLLGSFTASDWVTGKFGAALDLDQEPTTGDEISITAEPVEDLISAQFTISFWTNPGAASDRPTFGFGGSGTQNKDNPVASYDGFLNIGNNSTSQTMTALPNATANTWTHYTIIDDGTDYKVYIDGIETDSTEITVDPADSIDRSFRLGQSGFSGGFADWYIGKYDEFKIYNYARTAEQIIEDMNAGHPAPGSPIGSAVGHWKFDEGYGDTANDSGTGNNDVDLGGSTTCPAESGCPTWNNSGKISKVLYFDGTQNADGDVHARLSNNVFDSHSEGTISLWFKADDTGDSIQGIFCAAEDDNEASQDFLCVSYLTSDVVRVIIRDDNIYTISADTPTISNPTDWHHLVWTVQSSGNAVYLDGKLQALTYNEGSASINDWFDNISENTTAYVFGCIDSDGSDDNDCRDTSPLAYEGLIDEFKIYNFALTEDQVKVEYNQGKAAVWGASSTDSSDNASWSSADSYCPPGQGSACVGPVAEWKFDENTGTGSNAVKDTSGNGNHGTMESSMTESDWVPGKYSSALDFDGSDDYVDTVDLDFSTGGFTVSGWFKTSYSGVQPLIRKRPSTGNDGDIYIMLINDDIEVAVHDGASQGCDDTNQDWSDGNWHYAALSVNSSTVELYADGRFLCSNTHDNTLTTNNENWQIGGSTREGTYINGLIDEIKIYNYARTPAQIAWEFNRGEPIAWYKFDECSGTTAYDSALDGNADSRGNNATIYPVTVDNTTVGSCSSGSSTEMWNDGTEGKRNGSLGFDGDDDYVDEPSSISLEAETVGSISVWLKSDNSSSPDIAYNTTEGRDKVVYIESSQFKAAVYDGTGCRVRSGGTVDNDWNHVTYTWDSSLGDTYLYVNGVLVDSEDGSTWTTGGAENGATFAVPEVASSCVGGLSNWEGQIDDFRMYNYALTQQQVNTIYNDGTLRFGPNEGSP